MTLTNLRKVYTFDNIFLFVAIIFFGHLLLGFLQEYSILTRDFYYNYFEKQVEPFRLRSIVDKTKNFSKFKIIWAPLSQLVSVLGTFFCLNIAFMNSDRKINTPDLFKIILISSLIFFIPAIVKIFYFSLWTNDFLLADYNNYTFGSLMFLLENDDPYWIIALVQTFNFFEIAYWLLLALGISLNTSWDFDRSLWQVIVSYGVGLLFWVIIKMYFVIVIFDKG